MSWDFCRALRVVKMDYAEKLMGIFESKKLETLLLVKEAKLGIETYMHPQIENLNPAHKDQLIAFLKGATKQLEKK